MAALIGKPSISSLTTLEMTPEEYSEFRKGWIRATAEELTWDGISLEMAVLTAKNEFKVEEAKASPWSTRNEEVRRTRKIAVERAKYLTQLEIQKETNRREKFLATLKEVG